jgi:hypothetical protein
LTQNPWHWIIDEPNFSANEKLVALVIKRHANKDGWSWPSAERISKLSGLSRATCYRALATLDQKAALEVDNSGAFPKYRIRQQQGLLFSTANWGANALWESSGNDEQILCRVDENRLPERPSSLTQRREVRNRSEDRKPGPSRSHPERGSNLWKWDQKARRIIREIELVKQTYAGSLDGSDSAARRDARLDSLFAELERVPGVRKVG